MEARMRILSPTFQPPRSEFLTAEEVANLFRWRLSTVYVYASQRKLPSLKVGRSLRFRRQDLERLIEDRPRKDRPS